MGTYMGNVGNLMQHWTLCEVLRIAKEHVTGLNYIDAHAMAPWATQCAGAGGNPKLPDTIFRRVRDGMPDPGSVYEQAWHCLADQHQQNGYPSSAAFVRQIWNRPYSMLLCENNSATAHEIDEWIRPDAEHLWAGDWRNRFENGLPNPPDSLTLVSFDPYLYSTHAFDNGPNLYREDLVRTLSALSCEGPAIIQLSTYESQNNHQVAVISSTNSVLYSGGFGLAAVVRVDGSMMSMVYVRGVGESAAQLAVLPENFTNWLSEYL